MIIIRLCWIVFGAAAAPGPQPQHQTNRVDGGRRPQLAALRNAAPRLNMEQ